MSNNNRPTHSLASRLLPAVAMTAAASGLIAMLDRPTTGSAGAGLGTGIGLPSESTTVVPTQPPVVSSTLPAVQVPVQPAQQPTQQPLPTTPPIPVKTTPPAPAAGGACQGSKKDGPSINTMWGPVQVEAIISSSGQICDVGALRSPNSHGRSVRINQQALPILHSQVMKAQSTQIMGVSGATITSEGYVESLQAILNGG